MDKEDLKVKLLSETAKVSWKELEKFFAKGVLLKVSNELDLVEVAVHAAADDSKAIKRFMKSDQFGQVTTEQAKQWSVNDDSLWAVVVSPWVLVQQR